MLYIGLDVHRRRTQVAVLDESGHELFNRNVPNDREKLGEALCGAEPGTPVVFEAAYGWSWLAELLHEMGFEVHLAHARACKAIAHARLKNDRVDARTLKAKCPDWRAFHPQRIAHQRGFAVLGDRESARHAGPERP